MQLKLAGYKEGEFERFHELGVGFDKFIYAGDHISLPITLTKEEKASGTTWAIDKDSYSHTNLLGNLFKKDEKDPLNRFNGLFDGRTYGDGRFVLEINSSDQIYLNKLFLSESGFTFWKFILRGTSNLSSDNFRFKHPFELIGNLHENPELFGNIT